MSWCVVCDEEFFASDLLDPAEKCLCGEMARKRYGSRLRALWEYDRFRAIKNWLRYFFFRQVRRAVYVDYARVRRYR